MCKTNIGKNRIGHVKRSEKVHAHTSQRNKLEEGNIEFERRKRKKQSGVLVGVSASWSASGKRNRMRLVEQGAQPANLNLNEPA